MIVGFTKLLREDIPDSICDALHKCLESICALESISKNCDIKRARPRGVTAPVGAAFSPASTSSDALATAASLVVASAAPPQAVVHASDELNARRTRAWTRAARVEEMP